MRMKKLIFMFLAILLCGIVQAQTSEIILNNGKVVKGKIQSLSFNVDNTHEVRIKNEVSGENFDYTSADVKEIKFYDKKAKEVTNWIPLYAQLVELMLSYLCSQLRIHILHQLRFRTEHLGNPSGKSIIRERRISLY